MDLPSTIARPVDHELVVKKSRFLAHLAPATTVAAADAVIARRRKELWDARHHCVALVLGTHAAGTPRTARSSDDGEPSGTAGVPMLEVLRHREVTDVVAVVTRYFGGVKLGAGGLVRAYSGAVAAALDVAATSGAMLRRELLYEVEVPVPHADAGRIDNLLRDWASGHGAVMEPPSYGSVAHLRLLVPRAELDALTADVAAASAGALLPDVGDARVVDVPVPARRP
ncbi:IMPACT family protein [Promicromonospora sp. MS192]|uniref:IMPACT family protein n=1 Tax=Promicromonospora sp. MS192 TaxID=3412684 RepID=UPI003C2C9A00